MPLIALSANTSWYIYTFRLRLIRTLLQQGFHVAIVAPWDEYATRLEEEGCRVQSLRLQSKSTNPLTEIRTLYGYFRLYFSLRPAIALHFTPKPNIYGSLAARVLGILCINNIAGLGTAFIRKGWLSIVSRQLYKLTQRHASRVFFQNRDDLDFFVRSGLVPEASSDLLPGSGVDLEKFLPTSDISGQMSDLRRQTPATRRQTPKNSLQRSDSEDSVRFLLIARLIWDKGIGEYAEATRIIKARYPETEFVLLGFVDHNNPGAVPEETIHDWEAEGLLRWVGSQEDVRPFIADADCVVLPSYYREGTPRTLLEAAAMAKPLIGADSIGTREPVEDGETGYLCQPRDTEDLAEKMERIIRMGSEARQQMGWRGREKMEREYDENIVIQKYMEAIGQVIEEKGPANRAG